MRKAICDHCDRDVTTIGWWEVRLLATRTAMTMAVAIESRAPDTGVLRDLCQQCFDTMKSSFTNGPARYRETLEYHGADRIIVGERT